MNDQRRPLVHFAPQQNWMNDPNGLVWHRGLYHLYFQHNPLGSSWGNMSWGHATSPDLVTWTEHPVALLFDENQAIFSGSIVVDRANSAGLGPDGSSPLVAIYTSARSDGLQSQSLAFSLDDGFTWQVHSGNPVLDRASSDFRDPKVFQHGSGDSRRWIMVAVEAVDRLILIYSSSDLRSWQVESVAEAPQLEGVFYECPDLVPLDLDGDPASRRWVLLLSTNAVGAVSGPGAGSAMHYIVGRFDGHRFSAEPGHGWRLVDHGPDFYAAVTFHGLPHGRQIAIGWASNWRYAAEIPTDPWRGMMSLPRELALATFDGMPTLLQTVPAELDQRAGATVSAHNPDLASSRVLSPGRHYRLDVTWRASGAGRFGCVVLADGEHGTRIAYDPALGELSIDRTRSGQVGFHPTFASIDRAAVPLRDGRLQLTVVVDANVVEVFADGGATVFTTQVFPPEAATDLTFFDEGSESEVAYRLTPLPPRPAG